MFFQRSVTQNLTTLLSQRTGITTARLQGMEQDLHITGTVCCLGMKVSLYFSLDVQYATVVAILYASYAPAQIPSNMVSPFPSQVSKVVG